MRNLDTVRDSYSPGGLHWHTPALSLHLLLALLLPGSHGHGGDNSGGHSDSSMDWGSHGGKSIDEELRISLGIGLGLSLALHDSGGDDSVEAKSADQRTNSGSWSHGSNGSHLSDGSNLSHGSNLSDGSNNSSGLDHGDSGGGADNSGVVDHSLGQLDLSVDLSLNLMADVSHDVLALK